jgi:hypothetical protein
MRVSRGELRRYPGMTIEKNKNLPPYLGIPVRLHCLAKDSTARFSQLVDVMAERLFASAIDVEAWKALD